MISLILISLVICTLLGFTALSEKYSMNSKNGSNQLTKTLNGYLGVLVEEIIQSDGDVLKFAGKNVDFFMLLLFLTYT